MEIDSNAVVPSKSELELTKYVRDSVIFDLVMSSRDAVAKKYGIDGDEIVSIMRQYRKDAENVADEICVSKKRIDMLVDKRATLALSLIDAIMDGKDAEVEKIERALASVNKLVPIKMLHEMKQIVSNETVDGAAIDAPKTAVQINLGKCREAEQGLSKIRNVKAEAHP